ncbi:hypothetical protein OROGR_003543 [Orobanche gracilis]
MVNEEIVKEKEIGEGEEAFTSIEKHEDPKKGMSFDSIEALMDYYKGYGTQVGFTICKRSSSTGDYDNVTRYVTLACTRSGKSKRSSKNILRPKPISKTDCQAKVNAVLHEEGKWLVTGVVLIHNHSLSPGKIPLHRSIRKIQPHVKRQLLLHSSAGIRVNQSISAVAVEANGHENLSFIEKDARSFIEKQKRLRLGNGDAEALQNYFMKVQATDSNFFFTMDLDEENRLRNLFWADARSRAAYEEFGDVVTFDTTYLTNRYDMPFAPFVGVNHHGHSILLGCGLISNENTETFTWLFRSWLTCMLNHAPKAIITDQDKAMQKAIEIVFPEARHRWCLWHIMKKLPEKFGGHKQYDDIKRVLQSCVYNSLTPEKFEFKWKRMIDMFELQDKEWLSELYNERHRWVPCFVKDCFWAGMSTTQRSESMNSFFDGYVNSKTTLKEFVEKYEHALRSKVRKEKEDDAKSFHYWSPLITLYSMEKQIQDVYTTAKFREFQAELTGKMYCEVGNLETCGEISNYDVSEDLLIDESIRKIQFKVCLVKEGGDGDCDVKCNCRLFEFRGILCRHAIAVLIKENIYSIPLKYILRRWRKDIRRRHSKVRVSYSDWSISEEGRRYDKMCSAFFEVADLAYEFEDKCNLVNEKILALKQELTNSEKSCNNSQHSSNFISNKVCEESSKGSKTIHTPLVVRCKGRPRVNRLQSKVEQAIEKKRKKNMSADAAPDQKEKNVPAKRGRKKKNSDAQEGKQAYNTNNKEQHISHCNEESNIIRTQERISIQFGYLLLITTAGIRDHEEA